MDGFEHRAPIQKQGKIADVIEVEAQLLDGVLEVFAVRIVDLRPAGDAGPDQVTEVIVGNLLFVDFGALGPLGARPNEAHVAAKDVPELWKFIEASPAKEGAETRDAMVTGACVEVAFGRLAHSAKFKNRKDPPAQADA